MKKYKPYLYFLLYLLIFLHSIIFFMPKKNLYFLVEDKIRDYGVFINENSVQDTGFSLKLKKAIIIFKKIPIIESENINIFFNPIYASINMDKINFNESLKNIASDKIKNIKLSYSIFNPIKVNLKIKSDLGEFIGNINLIDNKVFIEYTGKKFKEAEKYTIYKEFKKVKGKYIYEYKF